MTRKVTRDELLDYQTWTAEKPRQFEGMLAIKAARRVHAGDYLTFLFENADTVRYQVQEMMRVEQIVRDADIRHELQTYNELLGGPGELGCSLLIEIEDEANRPAMLRSWLELPQHLYLEVEGGDRVRASFDPRQVGEDRLSAVQYVKFDTAGRQPVAVGSDLPALTARAELTAAQRAALSQDLATD